MKPEQVQEYLKELHELSPEPMYNGRDYFDNEELKQELEREQNAKLGQAQTNKIYPEK
jgi:hypothetical protein